jgi:hypothetical protein
MVVTVNMPETFSAFATTTSPSVPVVLEFDGTSRATVRNASVPRPSIAWGIVSPAGSPGIVTGAPSKLGKPSVIEIWSGL